MIMKRMSLFTAMLMLLAWTGPRGFGQYPAPPPAAEVRLLSPAELDQLLGPIALYPDPLTAQLLPAATLPSQVVIADRYVSGGGDPNLIDQQPWDPSIQAMARYPAVLKWMDDNLAWTTAVGQAFINQQQDVMDSIQRLRAQAQALGNLQSNPEETVVDDDGAIEILPANPQMIYVPTYQPSVVFYQQPVGVPLVTFGLGFAIGGWLDHDFDWRRHHLVEWDRDHPRPNDWWVRRPEDRPRDYVRNATVWRPRNDRAFSEAPRTDRGWNFPEERRLPVTEPTRRAFEARPNPGEAERRAESRPVESRPIFPGRTETRRTVPAVERPAQVAPARPASGALIGVQSSYETRQFSRRGQQSLQTPPRPAPVVRSTAPSRPATPARSPEPFQRRR